MVRDAAYANSDGGGGGAGCSKGVDGDGDTARANSGSGAGLARSNSDDGEEDAVAIGEHRQEEHDPPLLARQASAWAMTDGVLLVAACASSSCDAERAARA